MLMCAESHTVNFRSIRMHQLVHYVSDQTGTPLLFDEKELDFEVSFVLHKPANKEQLLSALFTLLKAHKLIVKQEGICYLIGSKSEKVAAEEPVPTLPLVVPERFAVHKLQHHSGEEIVQSLQKIGVSNTRHILHDVVNSLQWIRSSNSLLFSGSEEQISCMEKLITSLDKPLAQVFIEVLVIATDTKESLEFGLEWSGKGSFNQAGNQQMPTSINGSSGNHPFNLSVIGDLLFYRGTSFFSISALVSALEQNRKSSIVLNQKILSQDHKHSKIFVGDNIPFTGSYVQTVGSSQQTTANIEYRDIGVLLEITPLIGENGIVTLEIRQEISEASPHHMHTQGEIGGIQTTKTNMSTSVHVPDKHFLVLSGMMRNAQTSQKRGLPCLGSLPWIGALFSKEETSSEKRNILIFVCPHIIQSMENKGSDNTVRMAKGDDLLFHESELFQE